MRACPIEFNPDKLRLRYEENIVTFAFSEVDEALFKKVCDELVSLSEVRDLSVDGDVRKKANKVSAGYSKFREEWLTKQEADWSTKYEKIIKYSTEYGENPVDLFKSEVSNKCIYWTGFNNINAKYIIVEGSNPVKTYRVGE